MIVGISGYVGNRLTGIGRVLFCVVGELAKQHPEDKYVLIKNFDFRDFDELVKFPNVILVDVPYSKKSGLKNIWWHQWLFQKILRKYDCDVAYIPNFTLLLWKIIPTIVTIHDLIEYNVPNKFSKVRMIYRKKVCDPLMAKRSDHILTVSNSSYNDIVSFLGVKPEKITVTPNATDKALFKKIARSDVEKVLSLYGITYKKYLLFVGSIDYPGKNIKTVIDAFFNLRDRGLLEDIQLVIVGKDGYNSKIIYDVVNNSKYKEEVCFTGYVQDEYLPKLYSGALIMLYLSFFEGFGLPVLESMSCGTPVICSNTSCFPEIIGDLDVAVIPTDVKAVEKKIEAIVSDEKYAAILSGQCFQKSLKYSWENVAPIYHSVFSSFINRI